MRDPFDFTGKVVLITGGSRGLGREMALGFARRGADIVVASRKLEACEAVADEIRALGREAAAIAVHVGKWDSVEALADAAYERFGRIDILINNAGMSPLAPSMAEVSEELFDKVVQVNFKGVYRLSVLIGSRMAEGEGGSIINVSSVGSLLPSPYFPVYAGAKAAVNALTTALAREYAPKVRVNVVCPGGFLTDVAGDWAEDPEALESVMLNRFAQPDELLTTAFYLASEGSSFTTGALIRVDGGAMYTK
ncbi:short-chain dehydrogenase [Novosphingobium marinum]|uniref:NAD(P)-dependent dehydrogenase (Short-subunit alcohol dehydrogenase family) n=1 Tax=Novosphingobium marinum TaxID=1514948 RepID=A0A7Y9XVT1_9SPHN|nr:glucose 1-dehydrogenase [Novosphingobium marinum]NYH95504.1 NAD(P)-dependent dehydrogenase (short-subunit alcohol dehydrogenase family) [Novosphingobium marinum]GGC27558.1 short-chain dehydrogenase [Novosphingobium marinum]